MIPSGNEYGNEFHLRFLYARDPIGGRGIPHPYQGGVSPPPYRGGVRIYILPPTYCDNSLICNELHLCRRDPKTRCVPARIFGDVIPENTNTYVSLVAIRKICVPFSRCSPARIFGGCFLLALAGLLSSGTRTIAGRTARGRGSLSFVFVCIGFRRLCRPIYSGSLGQLLLRLPPYFLFSRFVPPPV